MTDDKIEEYLELLNDKNNVETIFSREISKNVDLARVWTHFPEINNQVRNSGSLSYPYSFFFIKNEFDVYVGAVLDMDSDLHWYTSPSYRNRGIMISALTKVIIPYKFREVDIIQISIDKNNEFYSNSLGIATKLGFKHIDENENIFELRKSDFKSDCEEIKVVKNEINIERTQVLKQRIFYAAKLIQFVGDELFMSIGEDYDFGKLAEETKNRIYKIEDSYIN